MNPGEARLHVYLVTVGAGDAVWERFGHSALWLRDPVRGIDIAYNWGIFDFKQPHFITRFLTGNTAYVMAGFDPSKLLANYSAANRSVAIQELRLTSAQSAVLLNFVEWNARSENRTYRYDYFRDNCATRIRDALDMALGGKLHRALEPLPTAWTYRSETQRLVGDDPLLYAGVTVVLGEPADQPLSAWEDAFLPQRLSEALSRIDTQDSTSRTQPLVGREWSWFRSNRPVEATVPPRELPTYLAVGALLAVVILLLGSLSTHGTDAVAATATVALVVIGCTWSLLAGTVGLVLVAAWTLTGHVFMYWNENLLQFNPLSLALAVVLPVYLFGSPARLVSRRTTCRTSRRLAVCFSVGVAGLSLGGLSLKSLPWASQANWQMLSLALPVHLALALAIGYRQGQWPARV